jgi:4-hydroxy-tetrahydrodipicolinate reductase
MRIALIGYGKMGKLIEELAIEQGHEVVLKISIDNTNDLNESKLTKADVAIEFTGPDSAFENVKKCLEWGVPVISGSTGWNENIDTAKQICRERNGSFLHASNFSIGVNIFFQVNKLLAKLMASQNNYKVSIKEIHHTEKKDAPSGTAVTLAEQIIANTPLLKNWSLDKTEDPGTLVITSERIDPAPGTHIIQYTSDIDDIEIIHTAHNRKGFASGAIKAAEFIHDKKGVFQMDDVLNSADLNG